MPVLDLSVVSPVIARRNGLDFFEVVIREWGDIGQGAVALEKVLPKNVSLAGACIGPMSTVNE